jgi:hypothetical protein
MNDRLTLARALEDGGVARAAAEHIATEIFVAIHDSTATKADLEGVKGELSSRIEGVKGELLSRIEGVKGELSSHIESVRAELSSRIDSVRAELLLRLAELEHRMTVRFGSVVVVVTGIILAAIRYLPHS